MVWWGKGAMDQWIDGSMGHCQWVLPMGFHFQNFHRGGEAPPWPARQRPAGAPPSPHRPSAPGGTRSPFPLPHRATGPPAQRTRCTRCTRWHPLHDPLAHLTHWQCTRCPIDPLAMIQWHNRTCCDKVTKRHGSMVHCHWVNLCQWINGALPMASGAPAPCCQWIIGALPMGETLPLGHCQWVRLSGSCKNVTL